jgi:tyrosine-protein kinase Etk/Wzc
MMEKIEDIINLIDSQDKEKTNHLLFKYIKQWPWFILFSVIGVLSGYFIFKNSPVTYKISSRILVKSEEKELNSVLAFKNSRLEVGNNTDKENKIQILRSFTLYRKALENLNWNFSWYQKKLMYKADLYGNEPFELLIPQNGINTKNTEIEVYMINENEFKIRAKGESYQKGYAQMMDIEKNLKFGEPFVNEFFNFTINKKNAILNEPYILIFNNLDAMTSEYLAKTVINSDVEKSDIITIMIEGQSRQREADFINELNKVLIEFGLQNKFESSENSVKFIDSQLERLKGSLGTAEENISNYRKNNQVMNLGQEAESVYKMLQDIEQEQYLTQMQIDFYNNLLQYIDDAKKVEEMVNPSVIGITDSNLSETLKLLRQLYSRREVLSYSVQDKNPTLIVLENEIRTTRDGLEQTLKNQLQVTKLKMESLDERHGIIQQRLKKLPETEKKLIGVQREFDLNNEFYTYMLQKKTEASISKASIAPEVQIIDNAIIEAATQTGPNLILNVAAGMIGGGIIPFIFITLIIIFNNKIETVKEVENGSRIPVFEGIISHKYKVNLPVIHHPRSGIAESFRGLKTNINTLVERTDSKVISINSLVPEEGKSFISSNLSAILSKTNKRVLLIGADLHKPTLHNFLDVKESFGLGNYLNNEKSIEDIISATYLPNLFLIQTGNISENPSDLMDSIKFEKLMEQTRKIFDYIIIDNAPLLLVPDAILTSQFSDISLFILRINYSHKEQIKQINKIVDFNKISCAAIVLNDIPESGYGYSSGYRKKYWKNGYGEYNQKV